LIDSAIEEVMRFVTVAHRAVFRMALDDIEIGDVTIRAGDGLLIDLAAANRDPKIFADPDRFDIRRDARMHLGFGYGLHQCLGQALARMEMRVLFPSLFTRFPEIALAKPVEELEFDDALIYGVTHLPLLLHGEES
jgi:cytochrome P450